MGCDIHIFTEVRNKANGTWEFQSQKFTNRYYRENEENKLYHEDDEVYESNPMYVDEPYSGRNYVLFGVLADVRNYDEHVKTISYPKGVPKDASVGYKKEVKRMEGDGHSYSYYTLDEIFKYDFVSNLYKFDQEYEPVSENIASFICSMEKVVEILDEDPKDIRIVFFFDN